MKIERKPFNVMLSEEEKAALEVVRGNQRLRSAGDAIRWMIAQSGLTPTVFLDPDDPIVVAHVANLKPGQLIRTDESGKIVAPLAEGVQFGPTKAEPGERLKKGKAK